MYAVVRTGGKQLRVEPGDRVRVERVAGEVGDAVSFGEVLMVGDAERVTVGRPLVSGVSIRGTITAQDRHPKLRMFKFKRRKGSRRRHGHRQDYTEILIDGIDR
jgi:large subunit ribosomal protein L21